MNTRTPTAVAIHTTGLPRQACQVCIRSRFLQSCNRPQSVHEKRLTILPKCACTTPCSLMVTPRNGRDKHSSSQCRSRCHRRGPRYTALAGHLRYALTANTNPSQDFLREIDHDSCPSHEVRLAGRALAVLASRNAHDARLRIRYMDPTAAFERLPTSREPCRVLCW
jgi:hypothetical protein